MNAPFERGPGDSRHDALTRLARDAYHRPPPTPAEPMWAAIEARLAEPAGGTDAAGGHPEGVLPLAPRRPRWARATGLAVAASAILALGVGLGRMTAGPDAATLAEAPTASRPTGERAGHEANRGGAVAHLATDHLDATASLFTFVRADARAGRVERGVGPWARSLLTDTRLLLDTGDALDPALRELLYDLEILLAQVALLDDTQSPERAREELALILQGLDQQSMMTRLQAAVPAGGLSGT